MNINGKKSERGQAIVYLVIGIIVFFGFVALAIDGGMALADRRHEQNAADASSLAGGGKAALSLENAGITTDNWSCGYVNFAMNNAEVEAIERAKANNFKIYNYSTAHTTNYVATACSSTLMDEHIDVTVDISATTQSNFLQIVYPKALHNEVTAVTRVLPDHPFGYGNAIIALNKKYCTDPGSDGGIMYGSAGINIIGGGIFSNGCLRGNGQPTVTISCDVNHDGIPEPAQTCGLEAIGNQLIPGNANWDPDPIQRNANLPLTEFDVIPQPTMGAGTCTGYEGNSGHYIKANELEKELQKNHPYTFEPGLWCIDGSLSINGTDEIKGDGVTLFMANGDLVVNGTPSINLYAVGNPPYKSPSGSQSAIPEVLIYVPAPTPFTGAGCPNHKVQLNGNQTSEIFGIVLAPCAYVQLNGTGQNTYTGQVVGWDVEVGGTSDLYLTYNGSDKYNTPTSIFLHK